MPERRLRLDPLRALEHMGGVLTKQRAASATVATTETAPKEQPRPASVRVVQPPLPKPDRRRPPRRQTLLRPGTAADLEACRTLDATYTTSQVLQVDLKQEGEELRVTFRHVRLPRDLTLVGEHRPPSLVNGAVRRGQHWIVAEEVDPGSAARRPKAAISGYVVIAAAPGEENAYIQPLVVTNAHRRKGIGRRLLAEARRWAAAQGATYLMADVPARNYPAHRLLQQAGFTFCGYNDRCYGHNEVAVFFACRLR